MIVNYCINYINQLISLFIYFFRMLSIQSYLNDLSSPRAPISSKGLRWTCADWIRHLQQISRRLRHYSRASRLVPDTMPDTIRKMSSAIAVRFSIKDQGYIKPNICWFYYLWRIKAPWRRAGSGKVFRHRKGLCQRHQGAWWRYPWRRGDQAFRNGDEGLMVYIFTKV